MLFFSRKECQKKTKTKSTKSGRWCSWYNMVLFSVSVCTDEVKEKVSVCFPSRHHREGDSFSYSFNTKALSSHLTTMAGKKTAPFYNMQLVKYEVCEYYYTACKSD